ncbi:MAG TPA: PEGA domain-containing protein, partial [Polyangia bacterium]|nr:PEGA domain-containing protein [Polyangia bacterium]
TAEKAENAEKAIGEVLGADARFNYKPFVSLLEPTDDVPRLLGEADIAVVDADQAFGEMDLEKAKKLLQSAIDTYTKFLPQLAERGGGTAPLRDAYIRLSKTRFFDGDNDGSRDALRYVWVLDPTTTFNPKTFPPQMKKTVNEAKLLFSTLGNGKLTIDSDPPGAEVWLNGVKLPKVTPIEAEAPPGPNLVSYRHRGYASITKIVETNGGGETTAAMQGLERHTNNPLAGINRARLHLDEPRLPSQLRESVKALPAEMILLLRFGKREQPDGSVMMSLSAYLYDTRPDRVIKKGERLVPDAAVPDASRDLTKELTTGIRLDGVWVPPIVPKPEKKPSLWAQHLRERMGRLAHNKIFWYVAGGVAGAAIIATVVGVTVAHEHHQQAVDNTIILGAAASRF